MKPSAALLFCTFAAALPGAALWAEDAAVLPGAAHNEQHIVVLNGTLTPLAHAEAPAAGYFTIRNNDSEDHLLKGISSPACAEITARPVDQEQSATTRTLFRHLALPHNSEMVFPATGYHFECLGLRRTLTKGEKVPFTFDFLGGQSITLGFTVTEPR